MQRFTNKLVVITGGTSGIGLATAKQILSEGGRVVVTGRTAQSLAQADGILGGNRSAFGFVADAAKPNEMQAVFEKTREHYGEIDVLFVNAGVAKLVPIDLVTEELFDQVFATNIRGAFFTMQRALPHLRNGGAIVLNASWFVNAGVAGTSVLSASKAALRNLARTVASELLPRKIRVNVVSPGAINTPLYSKLGLDDDVLQERFRSLRQRIPEKRFGASEEVARAVAFLASDDASYINGVELAVDGGLTQL